MILVINGENMNKELIKTEINVYDNKIGILRIGDTDYLSLTDLAKYSNPENPANVIIHWMSNKGTFAHPDIAFEFASWLSPTFKLYLIKEFER